MKFTAILIDDDHGPMDYYIEALQIRGLEVRQIDSTDETFKWLDDATSQPPNIIVLDMMMPPGSRLTLEETDGGLRSGVFISQAIRKKFPGVPLVALTNYNDPEVVQVLPQGTLCKAKFEVSPFAFADFVKKMLGA